MFEFIVWYSILHPSEKEVLSEWISETLYTRHQRLVNFPSLNQELNMQVEIPAWGIITFICLIVFMVGYWLYKKGKLGDVLATIFFLCMLSVMPIALTVCCIDMFAMDRHKFLTLEEKKYINWEDKLFFKTVPYSEIKRRIRQAEEDKQNEEKAYRDSQEILMVAFVIRYSFMGDITNCVILAHDEQDAVIRFMNSQMSGTEIISIKPVNQEIFVRLERYIDEFLYMITFAIHLSLIVIYDAIMQSKFLDEER